MSVEVWVVGEREGVDICLLRVTTRSKPQLSQPRGTTGRSHGGIAPGCNGP
jgi:hypothetical protein